MYGRITYAAGKNMYGRKEHVRPDYICGRKEHVRPRRTCTAGLHMYGRITYVRPDYICTAEKMMYGRKDDVRPDYICTLKKSPRAVCTKTRYNSIWLPEYAKSGQCLQYLDNRIRYGKTDWTTVISARLHVEQAINIHINNNGPQFQDGD